MKIFKYWYYFFISKFSQKRKRDNFFISKPTECPNFYRKFVLHLFKYTTNIYLSRCVQICGKFWDTHYIKFIQIYLLFKNGFKIKYSLFMIKFFFGVAYDSLIRKLLDIKVWHYMRNIFLPVIVNKICQYVSMSVFTRIHKYQFYH